MITYTEKRFCEWYEDEISVTLRASSGSYGGAVKCSFWKVIKTMRPLKTQRYALRSRQAWD